MPRVKLISGRHVDAPVAERNTKKHLYSKKYENHLQRNMKYIYKEIQEAQKLISGRHGDAPVAARHFLTFTHFLVTA